MNKEQLIKSLRRQKIPEKILHAFEKIKREDFIPACLNKKAYEDTALPIGKGQTISQPYTISIMLLLLEPQDNQKILEVGSGSGYVLALINEISKNSELYGIERIKELAETSKKILSEKENIKIIYGDGSKGLPEYALFDRIIVSAASEEIPQKLLTQLKIGGILVAPIKDSIIQIKKYANENQKISVPEEFLNQKFRSKKILTCTKFLYKITEFPGFVFVPLIEGKPD